MSCMVGKMNGVDHALKKGLILRNALPQNKSGILGPVPYFSIIFNESARNH